MLLQCRRMDPRVFKVGVPRGIPRVKWVAGGGAVPQAVGQFASDAGEGVFRTDKRTVSFTSAAPAVALLVQSPDERSRGPGREPGIPKDTAAAHIYPKRSYFAQARVAQRPAPSNAEQMAKRLPTFEFVSASGACTPGSQDQLRGGEG
eukprot:COSAG01_NODE_511_length_16061_cov_15.815875_14_plen_148_part_00